MNGSDIVESAAGQGVELPQHVQDALEDMDGMAEGFKPRWGNEAYDPESQGEEEYSEIESEDEEENEEGYTTEWRRSPNLF